MGNAKKVALNVFAVGSDSLSGSGDCMVYAIGVGNNGICLIDAGTVYASKILQNIDASELKGRQLDHLILTHCHYDHIGAAHIFKEKCPNLKIYAHDWDVPAIQGERGTEGMTAASWYGADLIPVRVDYVFKKDVEVINLDRTKFSVFHIPGHTPGSIAVLIETEGKKILFGQDIHGPFMDEFHSNIKDWANSMKKLMGLDADILCEGHFGIYYGKEKVKDFIGGYLRQHGF